MRITCMLIILQYKIRAIHLKLSINKTIKITKNLNNIDLRNFLKKKTKYI